MFNVKGVTTPTLIQHGEADVRVPISQGYEFYNALKRQGVTTRMMVYPRQPHGFTEPKMTLDAARANLEWFNRLSPGIGALDEQPIDERRASACPNRAMNGVSTDARPPRQRALARARRHGVPEMNQRPGARSCAGS